MKISYLFIFISCLLANNLATAADTLGVGQPYTSIQKDTFWQHYQLKEQKRQALPYSHEEVAYQSEKYGQKFLIYTVLNKENKLISGHCKFNKNFIASEKNTFNLLFQEFFRLFTQYQDAPETATMGKAFCYQQGKLDRLFMGLADVFSSKNNIATIELFHCVVKVSCIYSDFIEISIYAKDWKVCSVDGNSDHSELILNKLRQKGKFKHPSQTIELTIERPGLMVTTYSCYTIEFTTPEQAYHYYQASGLRFINGAIEDEVKILDYFTKNMVEYELRFVKENLENHRLYYLVFQEERTVICLQIEGTEELSENDAFEFGYDLYKKLTPKK